MNEWIRTELALAALAAYMVFIVLKVQDIRKARQSPEVKILRFEFFRLGLDCGFLLFFLLSSLCPRWFGLFDDTALGYCTGCIILISVTLLISVFVDWFPYRRRSADGKPSFSRFLLRQMINVCRIGFAMTLVWVVFLLTEPTKISLAVRIGISALVLLLLREGLLLARKRKKQKAEKFD